MSPFIGSAHSQVVDFLQFRNAEHFHLLNEVEAYWEALRGGAPLPFRDQIDPRGLERALDNIFYIEKLGPGALRFRLAGSLIEQIVGMDPRSMPFASIFEGTERETARTSAETALQRPQVVRMRLQSRARDGQPLIRAGLVLLPLRDTQGLASKALGCLQLSNRTDARMRRFHIQTIVSRTLETPMPRPKKMPPLIEEAITAFNEDPVTFDHRPAKRGKVPHLRVVKS